jgi:hypothetical protein
MSSQQQVEAAFKTGRILQKYHICPSQGPHAWPSQKTFQKQALPTEGALKHA